MAFYKNKLVSEINIKICIKAFRGGGGGEGGIKPGNLSLSTAILVSTGIIVM